MRRCTPSMRGENTKKVYRLGDKEQKKYTMVLRPEADPKEIDLTQLAPDDKPLIIKSEKHKDIKYTVLARDGYTAKHEVQ